MNKFTWKEVTECAEQINKLHDFVIEDTHYCSGVGVYYYGTTRVGVRWHSVITENGVVIRQVGDFTNARRAYFDAKAALAMWITFGTFDYRGVAQPQSTMRLGE